jgi:hypothetical protein
MYFTNAEQGTGRGENIAATLNGDLYKFSSVTEASPDNQVDASLVLRTQVDRSEAF